MRLIRPIKAGLSLGALLGVLHALWALLVLVEFAQPLLDFIFKIHMIKPVYVVEPFNLALALGLVAVTSLIGFGMGVVFAMLWNRLRA